MALKSRRSDIIAFRTARKEGAAKYRAMNATVLSKHFFWYKISGLKHQQGSQFRKRLAKARRKLDLKGGNWVNE